MRILFFIVLAVLFLGVLFFLFRLPSTLEEEVQKAQSEKQQTSPTQAQTSEQAVSLVIKGGEVISGNEVINLTEGDTVILTVTSDVDDELHVHGYDDLIPVKKDIQVQHTLKADITGRFPIELHNTEKEIAVLEVQPK
jgi:FtsP/CotA-like multicopper oxidase with cupredoxin domain